MACGMPMLLTCIVVGGLAGWLMTTTTGTTLHCHLFDCGVQSGLKMTYACSELGGLSAISACQGKEQKRLQRHDLNLTPDMIDFAMRDRKSVV